MVPRLRLAHLLAGLTAGAALFAALASEWWGGLVPCALCLVERHPYRAIIALALAGLLLPRHIARIALVLITLATIASTIAATVHVGVERKLWPSPMPECMAPNLGTGTLAERLARMPAHPSMACEDPTYLIKNLPISMAELNLLLSLGLFASITWFLATTRKTDP